MVGCFFRKLWCIMEKKEFEYVGKLNPELANYWNIPEHANKPIVIYEDRKQHVIDRHLNDFGSVERIDYVYNKLRTIIKKPEYTFYNKKTNGIEFYKRINDEIVVAVQLSFGSTLKIKSFYPANLNKLINRQNKENSMIQNNQINNNIII